MVILPLLKSRVYNVLDVNTSSKGLPNFLMLLMKSLMGFERPNSKSLLDRFCKFYHPRIS
jgi:hypothetical protein